AYFSLLTISKMCCHVLFWNTSMALPSPKTLYPTINHTTKEITIKTKTVIKRNQMTNLRMLYLFCFLYFFVFDCLSLFCFFFFSSVESTVIILHLNFCHSIIVLLHD